MSDQKSPWERPIFVASLARSGSTLLQRVINVHPGITIWGEHGGMLKGITDAVRGSTQEFVVKNLKSGVRVSEGVIGELSDKETFSPWVSPFEAHEISDALRATMLDLFTRKLPKDVRWGFKEIRYGALELRTMMELFPEAHLVILARGIEQQVSSRVFAWGAKDLDLDTDEGRTSAQDMIAGMTRHWVARYWSLHALAEEMPDRTSLVAYSDLVQGSDRIPKLFEELGESAPPDEAIGEVLGARSGSSYSKASKSNEHSELVAEMIAAADYNRPRYETLAAAYGLSG